MNESHWIPGLIVLAAGLLVGGGFLIYLFRRAPEATLVDDHLLDLERKAQLLMEQLKEFDTDKHQLDGERFAAQKRWLEQEAAQAFRARDEYTRDLNQIPRPPPLPKAQTASESAPKAKGFFAEHPELKGALWGGGVVLFFVVLGLVLSQEQKPRGDGEITGKKPMAAAPAPGTAPTSATAEDQEFQAALEQARQHPDDLELSGRVGHELIRRQRFEDAERLTEVALGFDPFHVESRIHRAVLRTTHNESKAALEELEHLAITYPHAGEARLFLGGLALETGDRARALANFERYIVETPQDEQPPQLRQVIAELRQQVQ